MAGVTVQEVIASHDPKKVEQKLVELLQDVGTGTGSPITIYCAQLCLAELELQMIVKLEKSSKRLELFSIVLIVLTIGLMILAAPPFIEALKHRP